MNDIQKFLLQCLIVASLIMVITFFTDSKKPNEKDIMLSTRPMKDTTIVTSFPIGSGGNIAKVPDERFTTPPRPISIGFPAGNFVAEEKPNADPNFIWVTKGYFIDTIKNRILDKRGTILASWK